MNREAMVRAFQAGFDEWQRRYQADPGSFSDGALDRRGEYFAGLLDELAGDRPWAAIGE